MKISIFGLGYVGSVSSACLAEIGHSIIGVDIDNEKVKIINEGKSPVLENKLESLIRSNVKTGRLKATNKSDEAINKTNISMICVGTTSLNNGNINLSSIKKVCLEIGKVLLKKKNHHLIIIRSTLLPGTTKKVVIPILEEFSNKKAGRDFSVVCNPEFLRESTAVSDFFNPPKTVIGSSDSKSGYEVAGLYKNIDTNFIHTSIEIAEMIKYANNAFHALKVTFANEIGLICKTLGINSHEVMNIFCQDTKLNISPYYLKPGFAFGGSCLPKDLKAITYFGKHRDLNLPVLNAILKSNQAHIEYCLEMIINKGKKRIGILGFAFKPGTDDLRESPIVTLIEHLLGKGYEIKIYDNYVSLSFLRGTNKKFLERKIPHITELMCSKLEDILSFAEIIIIGNKNSEFADILSKVNSNQYIIDLVRINEEYKTNAFYEGICW